MRLAQIFIICASLVAVALGVFAYKAFVLQYPVLPNEDARSWHVEARINFIPVAGKPLRVGIYKPQATQSLALVSENVIAPDYGVSERLGKSTGNKRVVLTRREARGKQVVFYQGIFYELASSDTSVTPVEPPKAEPLYVPKTADQMANGETSPLDVAMRALIDEAKDKSADNISFALEMIKLLKKSDDRVTVLNNNMPEAGTVAEQASLMLNAAEIPARVVNGIELKAQSRNVKLLQWLEVFADGQWQSVDVVNDRLGVPANYLPWWRGDNSLVEVEGGKSATTEISVKYNSADAITQAQWKSQRAKDWVSSVSLFGLPVDTQIMFGIVLMIPIGGLVIVILRQMIGVPTFGTFMPVLVALSFRETGLIWGIVLFGTIVMIGLSLRAYFDQLRLLVVPRLASVLTIVVLLIAILTVIAYKLGINAGLSISLFPMIILTMMIERMALMTEEFGAKETRKTVMGSMFAATLAYFAMHNELVTHLVFVFPELLLIILSCTILLGRYNGYKLSEYFRFKKLARAIAAAEAEKK